MVDVNKVLKNVVKKGNVKIGRKETISAISNGSAKLIVLSDNCTYINEIDKLSKEKKIPIYNFNSNGIDLGHTCGKNYVVSSFAVIDEGDTNILQIIKKRK